MLVAKITPEKAQEIAGTSYDGSGIYNPVQDGNGDWIVTFPEAQYLNSGDIEVVEYAAPEMPEEIE